MSGDLPGAMPRVGPLAGTLIRLTVLVLPAAQRTRYDDEFRAELVEVPLPRRTAHAFSLLVGAIPLRRALTDVGATSLHNPRTDWRCRLRRHRWTLINDDNPENRRNTHLACVRCPKIKEVDEYTPLRPTNFIGL